MKKIIGILLVFVTGTFLVFSQQTKITGLVIDENGNSLPGATVLVKGTSIGTVTDPKGNFSINVPDENSVLQISYIGYLTEEITVESQTNFEIKLNPDIASLNEVVVIGYGTVSQQNLTTAISKVKPKDVPLAANNSVSELLFGRAAGLNVTQQSAEPGGDINLSIRGREDDPLIVVDGVIYPGKPLEPDNGNVELQGVNRGGLAGLNPNDIESIEVLKDASAAIYGIDAANGVILITTKKGKEGKLKVSYAGSRSFVSIYNYLQPLNATDYMIYYNQLNQDQYYYDRRMEPFGVIPQVGYSIPFSDEEIAQAGEGTNWLEEIMRPGSIDNHSITVSGGNKKVTYYFSGNYFFQKGVLEHSDLTKITSKSNISYKITKFLTLNTNFNINRNFYINSGAGWQAGGSGTQGYGGLQAALAFDPTLNVRYEDGTFSDFALVPNPVAMLKVKDNTINSGLLSIISLNIDIIPDMLKGTIRYGNNYETANRDFYIPSDIFWGQGYLSRGSISENRRQNHNIEGILNFNKSILDIVDIDAMAGFGQYRNEYDEMGIEASGMLDARNTTGIEASPTQHIFSEKTVDKKRSYFARGNLDFYNRYLIMVAIRYDGYDKFFPENKYAAFPSVSFGWKISNEPFLEGIDAINMLKLRASYGTTGQQKATIAMGRYLSDLNGNRQVSANFDNGAYIYPVYFLAGLDQKDLEWEKTIHKNIGLDFSLLKSRLSGSFDVYREDRPNLIYEDAPTASLSQIQTYPVNDGHDYREGYEIALRTMNIKSNLLEWNTVLNVSHYKFKWIKQSKYEDLELYEHETDPVNAIYVYETVGIYQVDEEYANYQPSNARQPGCPKFLDVDGNDTLNSNDVKMYNEDPNFIIGFGNTFKIKNFDLNIYVYGQLGAYNWNNSYAWANPNDFAGGVQNGSQDIKNVWSTSNPNGILPGVAYDESILGLNASVDTWLQKKDFIRCRNITLGYTFNIPKLKQHISYLRLYIDAQNPFIITKYKGDPEINFPKPRVSAAAPHPMTRTFSIGVNAEF